MRPPSCSLLSVGSATGRRVGDEGPKHDVTGTVRSNRLEACSTALAVHAREVVADGNDFRFRGGQFRQTLVDDFIGTVMAS